MGISSAVTYPGFWTILGPVGLLIDILGATLLALFGTDWFSRRLRGVIENDFSEPATEAYEKLQHGGALSVGEDGFDVLRQVFVPFVAEDITGFEYEERDVALGSRITIHFADGTEEEYNQATVHNAISQFEEFTSRRIQYRLVAISAVILLIGFLLQFTSYFARHFANI